MQKIDDLIDAISASQKNLIDALIQTKVLLYRLGRKDLAEWVTNEITGYPEGAQLPQYRILRAAVRGDVSNGTYSYQNYALPTAHLSAEDRSSVESVRLGHSIAALEGLVEDDKKSLTFPLSPDYAGYLFNHSLGSGYSVQQAWRVAGSGRTAQVLAHVRSSLLEFLLELNEKIGPNMTENEVKQVAQSPETSSMFSNAIFGDNVTIVVGNHNHQSINNQISKGDFNALAEQLKLSKVDERDIQSLEAALHEDGQAPELTQQKFGPQVKAWIASMMTKAIDASWQIELGVAGGLLTTALQRYYGW